MPVDMSHQHPLLGLLSQCPIFKLSHCDSFDDQLMSCMRSDMMHDMCKVKHE